MFSHLAAATLFTYNRYFFCIVGGATPQCRAIIKALRVSYFLLMQKTWSHLTYSR